MIAAIRRDREVGNSVEQRNVREHAMSEDRAMRFAPAPGSDVVALHGGNGVQRPLQRQTEAVGAVLGRGRSDIDAPVPVLAQDRRVKAGRSEERRVGPEGVSKCRYRRRPYTLKNTNKLKTNKNYKS